MSATPLGRPAVRVAIGLVAPVLALAWWQAQATAGDSRALAFAPLGAVASAAVELVRSGSLLDDAIATLARSVAGLLIGGTIGIAIGIALALSSSLDRLFGPLLHGLRQVPLIGWLPLLGLWFGSGEGSELIVTSVSAFFPMMLNAHSGVAHAEKRLLEVGRIYGFTAAQRFRHILLPAATPMILTGLTQALAFTWVAAVGTEILLGTGGGLGVALQAAQTQQRMDVIVSIVIVTGLLGFLVNQFFLAARRHLLRWQAAPV